ncbi:MAG: hypothetical protein IKU34_09310 [Clostridia bacterium]|nr:hypothetical protein [Clostridia bacterium]
MSGCLVNILLILGVAALLLVGACVLGFVEIDEATGAPQLNIDPGKIDLSALPQVSLPELSGIDAGSLIKWAYGVSREGMTVKVLKAGAGEAILVCCDGYTLLLGGGENGLMTAGQLLLCGAKNLSAAAVMGLEDGQMGGMKTVLSLTKPDYLLFPDSQTKSVDYNIMLDKAQDVGTQMIAANQGLTFSLGRATVRVVGPKYKNHTDERDDGLSIRIDYGQTSMLVMGTITQAAERELVSSGAPMDADVLICAMGGDEAATGSVLVGAVTPDIAVMTGESPANSVKVRLQRAGCEVYTVKEHGVMTLLSDGKTFTVQP